MDFGQISLSICSSTWIRDSHGLFDYETDEIEKNEYKVKTSCKKMPFELKNPLCFGTGWIIRQENTTKPSSSHEVTEEQSLLAYVYKNQAKFYFCPSFMAADSKPRSSTDLMTEMNHKGVWRVIRTLSEVFFLDLGGHLKQFPSSFGLRLKGTGLRN